MNDYDSKDEALEAVAQTIRKQIEEEYEKEIRYLQGLLLKDIDDYGAVTPATWETVGKAYKTFIKAILNRSVQ